MIEQVRQIYNRLTSGGSAGEQAVQSGVWVAGINIGDRILQLLKVVILARLLSPEAFGLLGIALLVLTGLRRFSALGFDEALVQHQNENIDDYLNTVWVMKIIRGVIITLIALLAAPFIADIFNKPQAEPLIQVIVAANLLLAIQNPAIVYFRKNLDFHKEFGYQIGSRLADLIVASGFAILYDSVWALAAGIIALNAVQLVLSYIILEYRPNISLNMGYASEMFDFGKWILIQAVLVFLFYQGDDAFVGWFFSATALGFYQIAYRYSNAPATEITDIIGRVAFPAFSKVQDNISLLRSGFYQVVQLSVTISFPMAAGIFVVSPQFVYVVLGTQWEPIIPYMQALAIWGAIRSLMNPFEAVFKSLNHPDYSAKITALRVLIVVLAIYPLAERFGVLGVIFVLVGQNVVTLPVAAYSSISLINGDLIEYIRLISYPMFGSTVMATNLLIIDNYFFLGFSIINLSALILIGILIYGLVMIVMENYTKCEFISISQNISSRL